jgi:uncharacterized protein DUF4058
MPSPFPGMNPYLEQEGVWQDFHVKFLTAINERLVPQVRPRYIVKLEEHIYVHELPPVPRRLKGRAEMSLASPEPAPERLVGAGVLEAPAHVELTVQDVERVPFLEVRDRHGKELITVLELLGPANKRYGADRNQYLAKREQLLAGGTHLVEVDLLRGGRPMPWVDRPECAYSVVVSRVEDRPRAGFWPIGLRERLPEIPIPLRRPDGDGRIDLQGILDRVYDAYGYEDFIYQASPEPPLAPDDTAWANPFVPAAS